MAAVRRRWPDAWRTASASAWSPFPARCCSRSAALLFADAMGDDARLRERATWPDRCSPAAAWACRFAAWGSAAVAGLPPARFATGSAVLACVRQIGAVLGIAVLVAVLERRRRLADPAVAASSRPGRLMARAPRGGASAGAGPRDARPRARPLEPAPRDDRARAAARDRRRRASPGAPIAELMGFEAVEAEEGRVVFAAVPGEQHYNPIGVVHGGLAATLLDSAMGCAVHSTLPGGRRLHDARAEGQLHARDHARDGPRRLRGHGRASRRPGRDRRGARRRRGRRASCSPTARRPA